MQELQRERETVVELVEDVMRRSSPEAAETVLELAGRPPGSREAIGRKLSMEEVQVRRSNSRTDEGASSMGGMIGGGARPRSVQTPVATPRSTVKAGTTADKEQEGSSSSVLLKQSSWGSRRTGGGGSLSLSTRENTTEESAPPPSGFSRNRDLWERRANSTPSSDEEKEKERGGGFRGSRNFWEQRAGSSRQKPNNSGQTPDLVMDLPSGALASSPPVPIPRPRRSRSPSADSVGSLAESSTSGDSSMSPSLSSADTFAAADTDTLKKSATGGGGGTASSYVLPPTPKPRPEPLILPDPSRAQMLPIRSPGPRTPKLAAKFGSGDNTPSPSSTPSPGFPGQTGSTTIKSPFLGAQLPSFPVTSTPEAGGTGAVPNSSFKPAVRVKPLLQVKPSEVRRELPQHKDFK
jgi:hypothetical protein